MTPLGNDRRTWLIGSIAAIGSTATLFIVLESGLSFPVYLVASAIVLMDGLDIGARLLMRSYAVRGQRYRPPPEGRPRPFAIVLSIHNMEYDLDELLTSLRPNRSQVWIIDDASTDATVSRLRASGWRFFESQPNLKKPGAIRRLLEQLPPEIRTVLVMDPDVRLPDNLVERVHAFQHSGAAALCPKVDVRPDGTLAEFQHIEYVLSFDVGRHSLTPVTVTSGVAVYDRRSLEVAMQNHSLSVYGEDLENAVTILGAGEDIVYDPLLVVETDGKRDLRGWFSQRVGWSFSLLKIYTEHFDDIRRIVKRSALGFYQFGIYFFVLSVVLWPIKIISVALLAYSALNGIDELLAFELLTNNALNHPGFFGAAYIKYSAIILIAYLVVSPAGKLRRGLAFMPFFFPYCILLVVPTTVGYLNWIALRLLGRRVFIDHYDDKPVLGR